jgi:SAM-dependent methyltransferase
VLAINWITSGERVSPCPACHADGRKRHLLDTSFDSAGAARTVALLQCGDCGARYADPVVAVDYHDIDQDGMRYYVEQGAGIDVMLEPFALLDRRPVSKYLEVGCSFGFAMAYARRALGWEVLGFDPGFVAAAGRRMLGLPIESRLLDQAAVPQGTFDLVFCSEAIEHIAEPDPFITILRHALNDRGVLLLTTPDGDAVTPDQPPELLLPVLSPSQHVILYNAGAIETLLRRHGFVDVRVRKNATQLQIVAALTPLREPAAYFSRDRYRAFLQDELAAHRDDTELTAGFGYRLLCEDVNAGSFESATATYQRLRDTYRTAYGYDIETAEAVPLPSPANLSLAQYGERLPFNLCGVWYCRGIIALLGDRDFAAATGYFAAAMRVGGVLRAILNRIGTDDISIANFCREAETARFSALVQSDPAEAVRTLHALPQNTEGDRVRLQRRLFVDLVNLGHFAAAEDVLPPVEATIDADALPAAIAYGRYLLVHKKDAPAAASVFARLRAATIGDPDLAGWLREVELAQLAALAFADAPASLAAMREVAANRGRLAPAVFAAHRSLAARQLFTDLANLGHLAAAEQMVAAYGPPIEQPIDLNTASTAKAYGVYLLNHRHDPAVASEMLAGTRDVVLAELIAKPDDAGLVALLRETEIALLTALAFVGRKEALAAIEDMSLNRAGFDADAFAAHLQRVRLRAAELFIDLGYEAG